jgi:hypothetical protein
MPCKFCQQKTNDLQLLWMKRFIDPFISYPLVNECLTHWQHKHSGIYTLNEGCTWTICGFLSPVKNVLSILNYVQDHITNSWSKGSGSKLHCRKRRVINLKSQCSQLDFPESRKEHFATQTVSLQKLLSTTKQLITLATSKPSRRMYRLHFGFATNKILKTTSIHEHDKIQLSFWGLFRGCWLAAAVFTFPKSVPWNFSLESRYHVP